MDKNVLAFAHSIPVFLLSRTLDLDGKIGGKESPQRAIRAGATRCDEGRRQHMTI
jgi:hypothetical protein